MAWGLPPSINESAGVVARTEPRRPVRPGKARGSFRVDACPQTGSSLWGDIGALNCVLFSIVFNGFETTTTASLPKSFDALS